MPIRAELRHLYLAPHRAERDEKIRVYGPRCMACGKECLRYLNLAHTTHNPLDWQSTVLWCPSCHAKNDARHSFAVRRRTLARRAGQLWLLSEVEWDPYASFEVPLRVIKEAQLRMFA